VLVGAPVLTAMPTTLSACRRRVADDLGIGEEKWQLEIEIITEILKRWVQTTGLTIVTIARVLSSRILLGGGQLVR
jgi:hypothetical protein